jgi:hypothetical protein
MMSISSTVNGADRIFVVRTRQTPQRRFSGAGGMSDAFRPLAQPFSKGLFLAETQVYCAGCIILYFASDQG